MPNSKVVHYLTQKKNNLALQIQKFNLNTPRNIAQKSPTLLESEEKDLKHQVIVELRLVNEALSRLALGEYGVCTTCQQEITKQRLLLNPYAQKCIDCCLC